MLDHWQRIDNNKKSWFYLIFFLLFLTAVFFMVGRELIAVVVSVVFAYLLKKPHQALTRIGFNHVVATSVCVLFFVLFLFLIILGMIPPILNQANTFLTDLPNIISVFQKVLSHLAEYLPNYLSRDEILSFSQQAKGFVTTKSTKGVMFLINMIPLTFEVSLYLVLVPMMLFFMINDEQQIMSYCRGFLPQRAKILKKFWLQLDVQLGNYLQGKFIEVFIVGLTCSVCYGFLGMKFAILMGCFMGVGVLIPIVGHSLVTVGVIFIGLWQYSMQESQFFYLMLTHSILLLLDNNLLVPLLFSEKLNLHPLSILIATLFFGSFFGFWGLFFAIPLLTAIKIIAELYKQAFVSEHLKG